MKICFCCKETKELNEFYVHVRMADGHLNKCKACVRGYAAARLREKPEVVHASDWRRHQKPERKRKRIEYQRAARIRNALKNIARNKVGNAIRDGRLVKMPCEICSSEKSEAHHEDYAKPFDVRWLCFFHHRMTHGQIVTTRRA